MAVTELSALQRDALNEIFNIGIGRAAASLSEMINDELELSVPSVEFVTLEQAARTLEQMADFEISAVEQTFAGAFSGNAFLLFPQKASLELVRRLLAFHVPLEQLSELEREALMEVGNVILNACFCCMADILGGEISSDLPKFRQGDGYGILAGDSVGRDEVVLLLLMNFSLPSHEVTGVVSFVMTPVAIQALIERLDRYLAQAL